jgi:bacillithiol biosynthesis deacetylase BshB1
MVKVEPVEYLVVAPHPDDAELGMGGTIARLLRTGHSVAVVDMTSGEPTPFGTPARRREETKAASAKLGLQRRANLGLPNRELEATLAARVRLAEAYRQFRPRVVFIPYWHDAHPDHLAASQLGVQARFHAKLTKTKMKGRPHYPPRLIYYYCTHLRRHADIAFIVDISADFAAKVRAVECYQSQFYEGRGDKAGAAMQYVAAMNRYWGGLIGREYGEAFAVLEPLGLETLEGVV